MSQVAPLYGHVKDIKEKSGIVEFLQDGRPHLARFSRDGLCHNGVLVSSQVSLNKILQVGTVCSLISLREMACISENEKGIFYTAEIDYHDIETKMPKDEPLPLCNSEFTSATVVKLVNCGDKNVPLIVEAAIGETLHRIFIHRTNLRLNVQGLPSRDTTAWPLCEVGMEVFIFALEPCDDNDCTYKAIAELVIDQQPGNPCLLPEAYEFNPLSVNGISQDVKTEGREPQKEIPSTSIIGTVIKLSNCGTASIPRIVETKVGGTNHHVFIAKSGVRINGKKVKKSNPLDIPLFYIGMRVVLSKIKSYYANDCTLTGHVDFNNTQQSDEASVSSLSTNSFPLEGWRFGIEGTEERDKMSSAEQFKKSLKQYSSLHKDEIPNRGIVTDSASIEDGSERSTSEGMVFFKDNQMTGGSMFDLTDCRPFQLGQRSSSVANTRPPVMECKDVMAPISRSTSSTPLTSRTELGPSNREILCTSVGQQIQNMNGSTSSLPTFKVISSPSISGSPRRSNCRAEDLLLSQQIKRVGSAIELSRDQDMTAYPSPSTSGLTKNPCDTHVSRQLKTAGSTSGMCTNQDINITPSSSTSGPPNTGSTRDILSSKHIEKIVSPNSPFTVQDKPPTKDVIAAGKKPVDLQKLLNYCKTNLKMSMLTNQNVSHSGNMTVDQGTQTISTGDIIALGIYPGM